MNIDRNRNNGWAFDLNYANQTGLGMSALGGSPPSSFGSSLGSGSQYNVTNPLATNTSGAVATDGSTDGGIDLTNVSSPSDAIITNATNQWDALKASVDNIIYSDPTTTTPTPTTQAGGTNTAAQTSASVNSMYIVVGVGVGVLIVAGIILKVVFSKKGKK